MKTSQKKLLVIVGSTAIGKTDLAIILAKKLNGELVSCDSRQVYKGLDIGTGKLPGGEVEYSKQDGYWIVDGVKIWLYDLLSPANQYTVGDYIKDAKKKIDEISGSGKLPIVVGGTGFYAKALLSGLSYSNLEGDSKLRGELNDLSLDELHQKLDLLNSDFFEDLNNSDRNNKRRLVRYIEIFTLNENLEVNKKPEGLNSDFDTLEIGLTAPREIIYSKIDKRVLLWMKEGIIQEVNLLIKGGVEVQRFKELGLEYGLIAEYINNHDSDEKSLIEKMQTVTRQYAKRQLTWFRQDKNIMWFDVTKSDYPQSVEKRVLDWYNT